MTKKGLTGPAQVMTRITCERRGQTAEPVINFTFFSFRKIYTRHIFTLSIFSVVSVVSNDRLLVVAVFHHALVPIQSLTIPVNIRVTDANDNSPVFRNATYSVSISEASFNKTKKPKKKKVERNLTLSM